MPARINTDTFKKNMNGRRDINASLYDQSDSASTYQRDDGWLVLPIAGPEFDPSIEGSVVTYPVRIKVHASYGTRTVKWRAAKRGTPPVMPSPVDSIVGDQLLTSGITMFQPRMDPNQNKLSFAAEGVYTYLQKPIIGNLRASIFGIPVGPNNFAAIPVRKENDFYHTGYFDYQTPLLNANGYKQDVKINDLLATQDKIINDSVKIVNGLIFGVNNPDAPAGSVEPETANNYQHTFISPVFFSNTSIT